MAEYFLVRTNEGFAPSDELSEQRTKRIPLGEIVRAEIKKGRNVLFHRKYFALLNLVFQNQDKYKNLEDLLVEIKLKIGYYTEHITTKGIVIYVPKSISFAGCDQSTFEEIYSKTIDVCLEHFMFIDEQDLRQKVNEELELKVLDFS